MGGVVINLGLSKVFSIQPEFIYSQQGLKIENGTDKIIGKYDIVNVPLLLKLAFGSPKVKFFINAGPYIGYKLNQSIDINWLGFEEKGKQEFVTEYDATTGIKDNRFDFGGIGGAGFQFNIGGPLLILEGRYQYGMADPSLYKDGKPESMGSIGHTRVITGTVGLLFPLGGK
jgi:Outer membrane protein beta-barrel domain